MLDFNFCRSSDASLLVGQFRARSDVRYPITHNFRIGL